MRTEEFNTCFKFIEKAYLENHGNNQESIIRLCEKLVELKSKYDLEVDKAILEKQIKSAELQAQSNISIHSINTDFGKYSHEQNTAYDIAAINAWSANWQHERTQFYSAFNNLIDGIRPI